MTLSRPHIYEAIFKYHCFRPIKTPNVLTRINLLKPQLICHHCHANVTKNFKP